MLHFVQFSTMTFCGTKVDLFTSRRNRETIRKSLLSGNRYSVKAEGTMQEEDQHIIINRFTRFIQALHIDRSIRRSKIMNFSTVKAGLLIGALFVTLLTGCRNDGPVGVENAPSATQEPDFLKMPKNLSLQKVLESSALITPEDGGQLKLEFKYDYTTSTGEVKELDVKMKLKFPKGAVQHPLVARLRIDDEVLRSNVDITFNPHGSTFLTPAILDVDVSGMDVNGMSPDSQVWLYYDEDGTWVKMVAKKVEFKFKGGKIKCDHGELPHFSRYAFGR